MSSAVPTLVLVTGSNQGIGFEVAKKLAAEHKGYHILISGRREEAVEKAALELQEKGYSVEPLLLDLASDKSIATAAKYIDEKYGYLDVLVNNAGVGGNSPTGPWPRSEWQHVFTTNVFGVSVLTEALMPLLSKSQKAKRIVFVTSELGSISGKFDPKNAYVLPYKVYAASKAALNMLATNLAAQHAGDPTWKINLACPGHCATNFTNHKAPDSPEQGAINICRLATLGLDGETGTFTNRHGEIAW